MDIREQLPERPAADETSPKRRHASPPVFDKRFPFPNTAASGEFQSPSRPSSSSPPNPLSAPPAKMKTLRINVSVQPHLKSLSGGMERCCVQRGVGCIIHDGVRSGIAVLTVLNCKLSGSSPICLTCLKASERSEGDMKTCRDVSGR